MLRNPHLADGASEISVSDPESYLARMDGMRFGRSVGRNQRSAASPPSPPSSSSSVVSGSVSSGCCPGRGRCCSPLPRRRSASRAFAFALARCVTPQMHD